MYDDELAGVVLDGQFAAVLQENQKAPVEIADALTEALSAENELATAVRQSGADGVQPVLRRLVFLIPPVRIVWHGKWLTERLCSTSTLKTSSRLPKPSTKVTKQPKRDPKPKKPKTTTKNPREGSDGMSQAKGQ